MVNMNNVHTKDLIVLPSKAQLHEPTNDGRIKGRNGKLFRAEMLSSITKEGKKHSLKI